ncbi:unnamed protein product [Somion occarium]|uniref:C2H2-type domain-containing protein n=1 Tax=Somion occarium TaxID=3059160 RepID=A0ABP1CW25_9APHY
MSSSPCSPDSPVTSFNGGEHVSGTQSPTSPDSHYAPTESRLTPHFDATPPQASSPSAVARNGSKVKKFACQQCDRSFSTSGHLARHIRIHTGERNHKCPFPGCETRCSRQDNLQQHYRIHLSPGSRRTAARDAAGRRRRRGSSAASNSSIEAALHSPTFPVNMSGITTTNDASLTYPEPPNTPPPLEHGRPRLQLPPLPTPIIDRHPFSDDVYYGSPGSYPSSAPCRMSYGFSESEGTLSPIPRTSGGHMQTHDMPIAQRISSAYPSHHQQMSITSGSSRLFHSHSPSFEAPGIQRITDRPHPHNTSTLNLSPSHPYSSQIHGFHPQALHSPPLSSDSGLSTPEVSTTPHSATSSLLSDYEGSCRAPEHYIAGTFSPRDGTSGHVIEPPLASPFPLNQSSQSPYVGSQNGFIPTSPVSAWAELLVISSDLTLAPDDKKSRLTELRESHL